MKKYFFIVFFFLFFNFWLSASFEIIDLSNNYINIEWIKNISWKISKLNTWYYWNNYTKTQENKLQNSNYLWFIWNKFNKINNLNNIQSNIPIWFFWDYSWINIDFWLSKNSNNNSNNNSSNKNILEEWIQNINFKILNDWLLDYIKLYWDETNDETNKVNKIKIINLTSPHREFEILWNINEYNDYEIKEWYNMYVLVAYNSFWSYKYSDILNIDYKKDKNNPYLDLKDDLLIFEKYLETNAKLLCFSWENNIIDYKFTTNKKYRIDKKYFLNNFYCFVRYTKDDKILHSNIVTNNLFDDKISIKDFLEFIYWNQESDDFFNKKFYFLLKNNDLNSDLTYENLSSFLINIYSNLIIEESDLSFELLKIIGIYKNDLIKGNLVDYENLVNLLSLINKHNDFKNKILSNIDTVFKLNNKKVYNDFIKTYYINMELNKLSDFKKEELILCFRLNNCNNYEKYYEFLQSINKLINKYEYKKLWININKKNEITRQTYSEIIFKIIAKQEFYDESYTLFEYEKFIGILIEALFFDENIINDKLNYFTYKSLNLELISNRELFDSISYLTKYHLKNINNIYEKITEKNELLEVLRSYLGK